jgi:cytoskeleton protein RodZ
MTNAGFGEHLRREREMRGVSLEEIAAATRISTRFLQALEKETWDVLPGGIFNRGFVRAVARFLGLEEETLLAEYSLAAGLPGSAAPAPPSEPVTRISAKQRRWIALAAAVILAVLAGGWFGWRWISARRAAMTAAASALPPEPSPPAAPAGISGGPADPAAGIAANIRPWAGPAAELQLKIDAAKETSLTITSDGRQAFSGTILAGESRTVSAKTALILTTQDAGALRLELNGQALAPIGPPGQPGKITFGNPNATTDPGGRD